MIEEPSAGRYLGSPVVQSSDPVQRSSPAITNSLFLMRVNAFIGKVVSHNRDKRPTIHSVLMPAE